MKADRICCVDEKMKRCRGAFFPSVSRALYPLFCPLRDQDDALLVPAAFGTDDERENSEAAFITCERARENGEVLKHTHIHTRAHSGTHERARMAAGEIR